MDAGNEEERMEVILNRQQERKVNAVKKRKWYFLYDKVFDTVNLRMAWYDVEANKGSHGIDGVTIEQFGENMDYHLRSWRHVKHLHRLLRKQGYKGELQGLRMAKWRSSNNPLVDRVLNNQWFKEQGLVTLTEVYQKLMLPKEYVVSKPCA